MGTSSLRKLAWIGVVGAALLIGACTRSASSAPTQTPSAGTSASPLTAQQATMEAVRSALLTQTAQAVQGAGGTAATPTPPASGGVVTATPGGGAGVTPGTPGPVVATATFAPVPTFPVPASYTLHEGEFPYCLGRRFNRNPDDILAVNGLTSNSYTYPGQTLQIPTTGTFIGPRALISHPTTYVVLGGETIYSLACSYGDVYPEAIAAANGLSSPFTLTPGASIRIP